MRRSVYVLLIVALPLFSLAQRSITGKVTSSAGGGALSGVNVTVEGNAFAGATTNAEGAYSITVPSNAVVLVFSFVGKTTVTEQINGRSVINIQLADDDEQLGNVVVVGYGSKKKESLTGAISSIVSKEIQTSTNPSLAQKLQGKVSGLNIRQNSGQPGSFDNNINIRGFTNIDGNGNVSLAAPMYVIDGIVRNDAGAFQKLNPDDIESVSVIKDGSAAVYGIGAANGVIIVTTKQGSKGKAQFNYSAVLGLINPTNLPEMASSAQFAEMFNRSQFYGTGIPQFNQATLQKWLAGTDPGFENVNWYDAVLKKRAFQSQQNLSVSGGSDRVQYYIGMEYFRDGGLLKSGDMTYDRVNLRSNLTADLTKTLKAKVFVSGRWDKQSQPGDNFFNIYKTTLVTSPLERPYANNNEAYPGFVSSGFENPVILSRRDLSGYTENEGRSMQTMAELRWTLPFVKGLSIAGTGSFDFDNPMTKNLFKGFYSYTYLPNTNTYDRRFSRQQALTTGFTNNNNYTLRLQADYKKLIAGSHDISVTGVVEQRKGWGRSEGAKRYYGSPFYSIDVLGFIPSADWENSGSEYANSRLSYIGRVNYNFNRKYFIEAAFNYQGSYLYNPDGGRWGLFPVVSGAWRVSEENFIKEHIPAISNLKIKGSYGVLGTDQGDPWQYLPGIVLGGNGWWEFVNGTAINGLPSPGVVNPDITWVKNKHTNIGIEVSLWNNKLTFAADVYQRVNTGVLATRSQTLPNTFGASLPQENLNSNRNRGIDLELGHRGRINEVTYNISANFNYNRTRIIYAERAPFLSQRDRWLNSELNRVQNRVTGYLLAGQFQNMDQIANNGYATSVWDLPGDYYYVDVNGDGRLDGDDGRNNFTWGGYPLYNFGLTLSAEWRGFDASLLFQGAGAYSMRFNEVFGEMFAFGGNLPAEFFDSWHQANIYAPGSGTSKTEWIPGKWPVTRRNSYIPGTLYNESEVWRRRADYVRLKNLEIGYSFNSKALRSVGIQRLRVYANGFNLATWTKDPYIKQFDPEKSNGAASNNLSGTSQGYTYPLAKNYNFGFNVSF